MTERNVCVTALQLSMFQVVRVESVLSINVITRWQPAVRQRAELAARQWQWVQWARLVAQ